MRFITVVAAAIILVFGLAVSPVAADPIHDAVEAGDVAKVKALLASGVKVDARNEAGKTPLHICSNRSNTTKIVRVLLRAGADVNAIGDRGSRPLHDTTDIEVAKVLLEAGAEIEAKNEVGRTPLAQHAVLAAGLPFPSGHRQKMIEFLLAAGANGKTRDESGKTPFELAKYWLGRNDLPEFFKGTAAYWKLNDAQYD